MLPDLPAVTASKERPTSIAVPSSPTRRAIQVFDKKAVPTLDKFTGRDEDYFAWKESTIKVFGTAGYGRFFTDDHTGDEKYPIWKAELVC